MGVSKLALQAGISYDLAKKLQDFYFSLNPEIRVWHKRLEKEIKEKGYLTTIYGRRRWFLDSRNPKLMNEAAAFKPSSTIADLVNRGLVNIRRADPAIDVLLQTHDSLTCQYDIGRAEECRKTIVNAMEMPLDFRGNIITIKAELAHSLESYGDCH
jgi:DNA polymerase-1